MEPSEDELERFRREWKKEVSAKTQNQTKASQSSSRPVSPTATKTTAPRRTQEPVPRERPPHSSRHYDDGVVPTPYHDLDEKESGRRLDESDPGPSSSHQPVTALEHYEKAVEKEEQGSLGDSLSLYRKAFRMDSGVDKKYKNKHFPPSAFESAKASKAKLPSNSSAKLSSNTQQSLTGLPSTVADLVSEFSALSIVGEPAPTDLSPPPPCPIANIPEEILSQVLMNLAIDDVASMSRVALVCKRLAFLVMTEERIWKRIVHGDEFGLPTMHYRFACTVTGGPIRTLEDAIDESPLVKQSPSTVLPLTPAYPTYRQMFRQRPRIRFNGCYISTVNYTRPGVASSGVTWNSPVFIVTYYRYLRFFRDGSLISLLTTSEPSDVVPHLQPEHMHRNHTGALPQSVMKDALQGRWRLTGDPWNMDLDETDPENQEGDLIIETEGVVPKYMYKMHLALGSAGKGTKNNKLTWRGYWSWNRLTDDWAEFGLKNDRAFYWSRVKSFATVA